MTLFWEFLGQVWKVVRDSNVVYYMTYDYFPFPRRALQKTFLNSVYGIKVTSDDDEVCRVSDPF